MSMMKRERTPEVIQSKMVGSTFTVQTPMGPKEVDFGKFGHVFRLTYRGEDASHGSLDRLMSWIEETEEAHQTKVRRDALRKEVAKSPPDAVLVTRDGLEDIKVRGIDMRSNDALITCSDGTKTQVRWSSVLRPLNQSERGDLISFDRRISQAEDQLKQAAPVMVKDALADEPISLEISYDPAAQAITTSHKGALYSEPVLGGNMAVRNLLSQVLVQALLDAGYLYTSSRRSDSLGVPLISSDVAISVYSSVFKTGSGVDAYAELHEKYDDLVAQRQELWDEFAFDRSLVMVPDPEPEKTDEDEEQVKVSALAPAGPGDWDD